MNRKSEYTDVTKEWLNNVNLKHRVLIDRKYIDDNGVKHPMKGKEKAHVTDKNSIEYKRSIWVAKTFGGVIHNVPRITDITNTGISTHTPDYIWNNEKWELKIPVPINKKNNIFESFAKKRRVKLQANNFIVDICNTKLSKKMAYNYVLNTMNRRIWIDKIIVIKSNQVLFIIQKTIKGIDTIS